MRLPFGCGPNPCKWYCSEVTQGCIIVQGLVYKPESFVNTNVLWDAAGSFPPTPYPPSGPDPQPNFVGMQQNDIAEYTIPADNPYNRLYIGLTTLYLEEINIDFGIKLGDSGKYMQLNLFREASTFPDDIKRCVQATITSSETFPPEVVTSKWFHLPRVDGEGVHSFGIILQYYQGIFEAIVRSYGNDVTLPSNTAHLYAQLPDTKENKISVTCNSQAGDGGTTHLIGHTTGNLEESPPTDGSTNPATHYLTFTNLYEECWLDSDCTIYTETFDDEPECILHGDNNSYIYDQDPSEGGYIESRNLDLRYETRANHTDWKYWSYQVNFAIQGGPQTDWTIELEAGGIRGILFMGPSNWTWSLYQGLNLLTSETTSALSSIASVKLITTANFVWFGTPDMIVGPGSHVINSVVAVAGDSYSYIRLDSPNVDTFITSMLAKEIDNPHNHAVCEEPPDIVTQCQNCVGGTVPKYLMVEIPVMFEHGGNNPCADCSPYAGNYMLTEDDNFDPSDCYFASAVMTDPGACGLGNDVQIRAHLYSDRIEIVVAGANTIGRWILNQTAPYDCDFDELEIPGVDDVFNSRCQTLGTVARISAA